MRVFNIWLSKYINNNSPQIKYFSIINIYKYIFINLNTLYTYYILPGFFDIHDIFYFFKKNFLLFK